MSNLGTKSIWHSIESAEVLKELNTDPHKGLTEAEVKNRLDKYGYNELKRKREFLLSPSSSTSSKTLSSSSSL